MVFRHASSPLYTLNTLSLWLSLAALASVVVQRITHAPSTLYPLLGRGRSRLEPLLPQQDASILLLMVPPPQHEPLVRDWRRWAAAVDRNTRSLSTAVAGVDTAVSLWVVSWSNADLPVPVREWLEAPETCSPAGRFVRCLVQEAPADASVAAVYEEALRRSRTARARFHVVVGADSLLEHPDTLAVLLKAFSQQVAAGDDGHRKDEEEEHVHGDDERPAIMAPVLRRRQLAVPSASGKLNFWCRFGENGERRDPPEVVAGITTSGGGDGSAAAAAAVAGSSLIEVPAVHSTYAIDLGHRRAADLTYLAQGEETRPFLKRRRGNPIDAALALSRSARQAHAPILVSNALDFGYWGDDWGDDDDVTDGGDGGSGDGGGGEEDVASSSRKDSSRRKHDRDRDGDPAPIIDRWSCSNFGQFNHTYVINMVKRRPERHAYMRKLAVQHGFRPTYHAVDGKAVLPTDADHKRAISGSATRGNGAAAAAAATGGGGDVLLVKTPGPLGGTHAVRQMPAYRTGFFVDPATGREHPRPSATGRNMTKGEFGCFLSHYEIWQDVVRKGFDTALIFEDDVVFLDRPSGGGSRAPSGFVAGVERVMRNIKAGALHWDVLYLGSHSQAGRWGQNETWVGPELLRPAFTYGLYAYAVTRRGAQKLLDAKPLLNMIPSDDFVSAMYDGHAVTRYRDAQAFPARDVVALVVRPPLADVPGYHGDGTGYSDTDEVGKEGGYDKN